MLLLLLLLLLLLWLLLLLLLRCTAKLNVITYFSFLSVFSNVQNISTKRVLSNQKKELMITVEVILYCCNIIRYW